ncbi:toll/interleukin-1 receptor domain-containing protein [Actinokineospora inagensis]|uniref:toll/interleukin-1 receptor domain-containing protein n=1 Tax=Actinokineospora inagensis TaxID=103730 RepID=UPI000684E59A|nr:toll/interleukin-1 receptor domain-containing protein [Actinokineospora inagensis]
MTQSQNKVFINYRAADEPFGVALIDQGLSARFGSEAVFLASKSIPPGTRWEEAMFEAVASSTAVLVVMGRNWLGDRSESGGRRIDDPGDFVRREITMALRLDKQVIPVRLGVPRMNPAALPEPVRPLWDRQDVFLQFRTAASDLDLLAAKLRRLVPGLAAIPAPVTPSAASARYASYHDQSSHYEMNGIHVETFHAGPSFGSVPGGDR